MKKLGFFIVGTSLLFTACSSASEAPENTETTETAQEEIVESSVDPEQVQKDMEEYIQKLLETTEEMPQLEGVKSGDLVAVFTTSLGEVKIELFEEQAPKTVENFVTLAKDGYYDGLTFHRVINDFMVQGGDPTGTGAGGESIWGTAFEDEFSPNLYHFEGALSMANAGPNTNGSQFFIVQSKTLQDGYFEDLDEIIAEYGNELLSDASGNIVRTNYHETIREKYAELGGTIFLDYRHTVFGQVYEGMDIVDAISLVETDENDKPVEDVIIEKIEIITIE